MALHTLASRTSRSHWVFAATLLGLTAMLAACSHEDGKRPLLEESLSNAKMLVRADADMQRLLSTYASFDPKAIELITPAEARQQPSMADALRTLLENAGKSTDPAVLVPGVTSVDRTIPGAEADLPARVFTPAGNGPFPLILYFHGGGFVLHDRTVYDAGARGLAKAANAIVVSVDYRLAPEHPFPAAHEDAVAAYRWLSEQGVSLGGDPQRLALAGESAGGNLAVATGIAIRQQGLRQPRHILAIYPLTQTRMDTPSYEDYADAKPLNRPMMRWFIDHAIKRRADLEDPRLDLVWADLAGLPPVTLINAGIDPLLDDGARLENALRTAGVPVERRVYEGVTHEFFGMAAAVDKAKQAQAYAGERLKADLR